MTFWVLWFWATLDDSNSSNQSPQLVLYYDDEGSFEDLDQPHQVLQTASDH